MIIREIPRFFEGVRGRLEILAQFRVEIEAHLANRFNVFHSINSTRTEYPMCSRTSSGPTKLTGKGNCS